jgi:hemerythrin-like metal-binding protein
MEGTMELPTWESAGVATGHPVVDDEHRRLLELLHSLSQLLDNAEDGRDLDSITLLNCTSELINHVVMHFMHEESLIDSLSTMPKVEKTLHKEEHQRWKKRIMDVVEPMRVARTDLERRARLSKLVDCVYSFWIGHVMQHDQHLTYHIKTQGILPSQAF